MNRYVKRPIAVEAVKWKGFNNHEIEDFAGDNVKIEVIREGDADRGIPPCIDCSIKTLEGVMTANVGDYIIKGVNGEFYPCKPDIFEKTYLHEDDMMGNISDGYHTLYIALSNSLSKTILIVFGSNSYVNPSTLTVLFLLSVVFSYPVPSSKNAYTICSLPASRSHIPTIEVLLPTTFSTLKRSSSWQEISRKHDIANKYMIRFMITLLLILRKIVLR